MLTSPNLKVHYFRLKKRNFSKQFFTSYWFLVLFWLFKLSKTVSKKYYSIDAKKTCLLLVEMSVVTKILLVEKLYTFLRSKTTLHICMEECSYFSFSPGKHGRVVPPPLAKRLQGTPVSGPLDSLWGSCAHSSSFLSQLFFLFSPLTLSDLRCRSLTWKWI